MIMPAGFALTIALFSPCAFPFARVCGDAAATAAGLNILRNLFPKSLSRRVSSMHTP